MSGNESSDAKRPIEIMTKERKKFCESIETEKGMKLVSDQGGIMLDDLLKQAFGRTQGRSGKKRK